MMVVVAPTRAMGHRRRKSARARMRGQIEKAMMRPALEEEQEEKRRRKKEKRRKKKPSRRFRWGTWHLTLRSL